MDLIFYLLAVTIGLLIYYAANGHMQRKHYIERLKREWGTVPESDYTSEKMEVVKAYYLTQKEDYTDIDDITWNDLDMDEIYQRINNTQSSLGEEYLYALLRKPCFDPAELEERNRLMEFFQRDEAARLKVQEKLLKIGKLRRISAFEYADKLCNKEPKSNLPHYLSILCVLFSFALIFINPAVGVGLLLFFSIFNIVTYLRYKTDLENYLLIISFQLRLLDASEKLLKLDIPELMEYKNRLADDLKAFKRYKRGSSIVVARNISGNPFEILLDYYRMTTHHDLIKFNNMIGFFKKNREAMFRLFKTVGFLDSMTAAASFRETVDYYCIPKLYHCNNQKPRLSVTDVYHPLIENAVPNSITENRCTLITGSNASGKSTFIKSLAVNQILSQTIYTSLSRRFESNYFVIYSSMALTDSILNNESYFIVEIKSLKRILNNTKGKYPMLCFIDEVLRGTNTLERIAASSRILASLSDENALCFAATHDIELTYILENCYSNYHFREKIEGDRVLFDYKLYRNRAVTKNAIKLLKLMGYSESIIKEAEEAADEYLRTGEWKVLE